MEEQRPPVWIGPDVEHFTDDDVVVARLVLRVQVAIEVSDCAVQYRRSGLCSPVGDLRKRVAALQPVARGKVTRQRLLLGLQVAHNHATVAHFYTTPLRTDKD